MTTRGPASGLGPTPRHRPGVPGPAALELFYDLVFVAAVVVLSDSYSHSPTAADLAWLAVVFTMFWLVWMQTTLLFNVKRSEGHWARLLVLAQMLLIILAAVAASDGLIEHTEYVGPILAATLAVVSTMQWRAARAEPGLRTYSRARILANTAAGLLLLGTDLFGDPGYLVAWGVAIVLMLGPSLRPDPFAGSRRDTEHLVERFGAFTIIMLGESFVKTALTSSEGQMNGLDLVCLVGTFVIVFTIWWLYFSDVPGSEPPDGHRAHLAWILLHLPLHLGIVGIAVGTAKAVAGDEHELDPHIVPFLAVPLVLVLVCLAVIEALSRERDAGRLSVVHLVGAVVVTVIGLVATLTDPTGIEGTSVALAAVMVAVVIVSTRLRERSALAGALS